MSLKQYPIDLDEYLDKIAENVVENLRYKAQSPIDKILMGVVLVRAGQILEYEGLREWKVQIEKYRNVLVNLKDKIGGRK